MSGDLAVECAQVSKRFYIYERRDESLRRLFIRAIRRRPAPASRAYFAISDFNLEVRRGEAVALLGHNGCGKSTVLRLIAGIYEPTGGRLRTFGRVATVIELGAGFHPELTGRENIHLYGAILGLNRRELAARHEAVVAFADIGDFVDTPVKYYSSGMQARLAFAVAVCVDHEILLLDEVLAVGDETFRRKCLDHLASYHARGGTLVIASHDLDTVRRLCSRALWMESGRTVMSGNVDKVADAYHAASAR
jgi:ABC-type polysaccharide/polyol phosphate transport system ATPase subunit